MYLTIHIIFFFLNITITIFYSSSELPIYTVLRITLLHALIHRKYSILKYGSAHKLPKLSHHVCQFVQYVWLLSRLKGWIIRQIFANTATNPITCMQNSISQCLADTLPSDFQQKKITAAVHNLWNTLKAPNEANITYCLIRCASLGSHKWALWETVCVDSNEKYDEYRQV